MCCILAGLKQICNKFEKRFNNTICNSRNSEENKSACTLTSKTIRKEKKSKVIQQDSE